MCECLSMVLLVLSGIQCFSVFYFDLHVYDGMVNFFAFIVKMRVLFRHVQIVCKKYYVCQHFILNIMSVIMGIYSFH